MTENTTASGAADSPKLRLLLDSFPEQNPRNFDPDAAIQLNEWGIAIVEELYRLRTLAASAPVAPTQAASKRLIGWRTPDYLEETADAAIAKNWSVHHDLLPIFEGDVHTKLATPEAAPVAPAPMHAVPNLTLEPEMRAAMQAVFDAESVPVRPAPLTDTFVQTVPDKCDRIVWRNNYHHLPITQPAPLQQGEYLPLPEPAIKACHCYSTNQVREAIDADRAMRGAAQAAPTEPDHRAVALAAGAYTTAYSMLSHAEVHNADVAGSTKRLVAAINDLRSALGPSAPVAEDAAYTELHGQINYIAAYSVDALDALDRDRLLGFARSLVWRAQTSLEIANLARAQAAQPEGGAK